MLCEKLTGPRKQADRHYTPSPSWTANGARLYLFVYVLGPPTCHKELVHLPSMRVHDSLTLRAIVIVPKVLRFVISTVPSSRSVPVVV